MFYMHGGSDGEAEAGPKGCGATYYRVQEVWPYIPIYSGCIALASISTAHIVHDHVLEWCGSACLAGRPLICASSAALSLLVQAVVHCGLLSKVIWWSHSPVFFSGWFNNLEWTSNRAKTPPKWCLFSIPPSSQDCSFPLDLGRERLWVGILKKPYINFDWLIERRITNCRSHHVWPK